MPSLFDPIRIGAIECANRIFMSPLTRSRGTRDHVPTPLMVEYYRQRANAGLIISEATGVSQQGLGTPFAPGIWNDQQIAAWCPITSAVHAAGGRIICQLWHMGRVVHSDFLGGQPPVSSSAIAAPGDARTYDGNKSNVTPRALAASEIPGLVADFAQGARNAIAAGFDGVQLHAANGYLLDQFLRDSCNKRTDAYGGSPVNRVRLLREITEAIAATVGPERTAIRVSPLIPMLGCQDSAAEEVFLCVADTMSRIGIAFLEVREPAPNVRPDNAPLIATQIKTRFRGPMVLNTGYDRADAMAAVANGSADAITFGKPYIANPDLAERLSKNVPLATVNVTTLYSPGPVGYVDYPRYASMPGL
ncbi:MAG: alkene reductase [Betaproteobacteria bacterium]|nr:alkene reductase [Betaproteobacteria bacterium]